MCKGLIIPILSTASRLEETGLCEVGQQTLVKRLIHNRREIILIINCKDTTSSSCVHEDALNV